MNTQTIAEQLAQFEKYLSKLPEYHSDDRLLYEPIRYILELPGKRIRPLLTIAAHGLGTKPDREAYPVAAAVEFFHNFTLMHDDIMDHAALRRGLATVHTKWDANTAILSGDAMLVVAYELLVAGHTASASKLVRRFSWVAKGVCEGQMQDMALATRSQVSISEYLEMIRKKTAVLIGGAMELGGIAAGLPQQDCETLYAYGEKAGIGFQLQDDYMDAYPPDGSIGKTVGGDILENKRTFLLIRAQEKADPETRVRIGTLLKEQDPEGKISGMLDVFNRTGVRKEMEIRIRETFDQADNIGFRLAHTPGFERLRTLVNMIRNRRK